MRQRLLVNIFILSISPFSRWVSYAPAAEKRLASQWALDSVKYGALGIPSVETDVHARPWMEWIRDWWKPAMQTFQLAVPHVSGQRPSQGLLSHGRSRAPGEEGGGGWGGMSQNGALPWRIYLFTTPHSRNRLPVE